MDSILNSLGKEKMLFTILLCQYVLSELSKSGKAIVVMIFSKSLNLVFPWALQLIYYFLYFLLYFLLLKVVNLK